MSDLFYIQHRGYVGNSLLWWREGGVGYTCDLNRAWKVTEEEAIRICKDRPEEDIKRPVGVVDSFAQRHLDAQDLHRVENWTLRS